MILHYILHQFCILQNWWLPGVNVTRNDKKQFIAVYFTTLAHGNTPGQARAEPAGFM
jgi:hypothetical protein